MNIYNIFVLNALKFKQKVINNIKSGFANNSINFDQHTNTNINSELGNNSFEIAQKISVNKITNLHINQSLNLGNQGRKVAIGDATGQFFITYFLSRIFGGKSILSLTQLVTIGISKYVNNIFLLVQNITFTKVSIVPTINIFNLKSLANCYKLNKNFISETITNPPITGSPSCE